MTTPAATIEGRPQARAAHIGYLEALGDRGAIGWVWCPGHPDRLRVELRLADQVVATGVADQSRDDLARSGIGDGKHAFQLDVPESLRGRSAELRVFAHPIEGPPIALEAPPVAASSVETLAPLQRGIETLIGSQRLLHRNLQAALLQQGASPASTLADIASAQSKLNETLSTIELFVVRLETAFQRHDPSPAAREPRRMLAAAVTMSGLAFVVSAWALCRTLLGS